jgi:hypothetical protein
LLERVYTGTLPYGRLSELAEVALDAAAEGDVAAHQAVELLSDEVVTMTAAAISRLGVARLPVEVVLGGGIFDTRHVGFTSSVEAGIRSSVPRAVLRRLEAQPVLGAALLGLDLAAAPSGAHDRLRVAMVHGRHAEAPER